MSECRVIMALAFGWRRRRCPNSSVVLVVVAVEVVVRAGIRVGVKSIFLCFAVSTRGRVSSVQVCSHGQQAQYSPRAGEIHFVQCVMHLLMRRPSTAVLVTSLPNMVSVGRQSCSHSMESLLLQLQFRVQNSNFFSQLIDSSPLGQDGCNLLLCSAHEAGHCH